MSDYEEDFDDYDEDFESDSGLEAPAAAPHQEASASSEDAPPSSQPQQKQGVNPVTQRLPGFPAVAPQLGRPAVGAAIPVGPAAPPASGVSIAVSPAVQLSAAERSRGLKRLLQRRELLTQVSLTQQEAAEVFSLAPLTPYQLLSQGKGPYGTKRAGTSQTRVLHQDVMEAGQQTEPVDTREGSSQAPEEHSRTTHPQQQQGASGASSRGSSHLPGPSGAREGPGGGSAASRLAAQEGPVAVFLAWATPIMLQELSRSSTDGLAAFEPQLAPVSASSGSSGVATGSCSLAAPGLTDSRRLVAAAWAPAAAAAAAAGAGSSRQQKAPQLQPGPAQLCCAYSAVGLPQEQLLKAHGLEGSSLLCVWQMPQTAAPEQVLVMDGAVSCCCWGLPPFRHLVFAGTEEGAVCCWDTSEPARLHPPDPSGAAAPPSAPLPPPRRPSYTTEAAAPSSAIVGRVVALRCLLRSTGGGGGGAGGGAGTRASLSLLVLGEGGQLAVFGVVLLKSAAAAAAQSDAGMRVGSCVRLISSRELLPLGRLAAAPLHLRPPPADWPHLDATCLTLLPPGAGSSSSGGSGPGGGAAQQGPQQGEALVLVGTRGGQVLKGALGGTPLPPRVLLPDVMAWPLASLDTNKAGAAGGGGVSAKQPLKDCGTGGVVALAVSPVASDAVLCAHAYGRITLHSISRAHAVAAWQHVTGAAPVSVRWLPERPCLFAVLDAQGGVGVYDVRKPDQQPRLLQVVVAPDTPTLTLDVWSSSGSSGDGASSSGGPGSSGSGGVPRSLSKGSSLQRRLAGSKGHGAGAAGGGASGAAAASCWLVVGCGDGGATCFKLAPELCVEQEGEAEALQGLLL